MKEEIAGNKHAVRWLQTIVRDARGDAEHLRFLYISYKPGEWAPSAVIDPKIY
jgi:hypothetical protein